MEDETEFVTRDFYIAAFLLAHGHKIAYVNRKDPQRVFFAFDAFENRENLLRDFSFGKASVEPQAFISAIKNLKGFIHND